MSNKQNQSSIELYPFCSDLDVEVPKDVFDVPLTNLDFSNRGKHIFKRKGIYTLYDLLRVKKSEAFKLQFFGRGTYEDAVVVINNYIDNNNFNDKDVLCQDYFPLLKSANRDITLKDKLASINIDVLPLSVRARNVISEISVKYIGDLIMCSEEYVIAARCCGRKTLCEIKQVVASFLDNFDKEFSRNISLSELAQEI